MNDINKRIDLINHPLNPVSLFEKNSYKKDKSLNGYRENINDDFYQFLEDLKNAGVNVFIRVPVEEDDEWGPQYESNNSKWPKVFLLNINSPGGTSGRGLDGDRSVKYHNNKDNFAKFQDWENALLLFWPDIPFIMQGKIEDIVKSTISWNVNEYYGDSTDYVCDMIDLEKLYKILELEDKLTPNDQYLNNDAYMIAVEDLDEEPLFSLDKKTVKKANKKMP